ncbi:tripartite-type tricarboxylate transporter receptor subunit TctC [Variovorax paradoxus]|uniref:Tripartite-type tricarboxylate transporter receptor subunit TctC n=1 Tax=Variovorax paradoxus TaxID=34073 RepID=A0AAE3Y4Q0_VARPD|nr:MULTISPECIES: tripartite tricarboxylate transporter substrate-binding protein [Variovorax]MBD9665286.1 tripartite tricarboxylate transporter substrate binding protein [Variovorax sp. VRV01]MDP9967036.1 tripartite-type tricarboxylate transporter receptor subunit TctC [Variovorax paradoxus]MDQ0083874.1 tripartite-type tricarboxylate transporter receptor subunit TctC [Variovorax boronicumulans]MDR6429554.1 tripartite-type tricarboxylate transporter receptor subunit TctC [Variovorax paradoxus]M
MSFRFSRRLFVLAGLVSGLYVQTAAAQDKPWPTAKPITWIVGFVPGGSVDVLTRAMAKAVSDKVGQTIVIDNRPGASGALALQAAARASKDGYTLVTVPGPVVYGQRQPEIGKELAAVALMSQGPIVLVGKAAGAPANLSELIQAMKKAPTLWNFASSGTGTGQHLAGELFNSMAGTEMVHIPYKGGGQAVTDIIGGQTGLGMLGVTPVLAHIKSGQLKAYAVTTTFRIPGLPDVPTMEEAGLKGYEATQYFVAAMPAGVDARIVARLNVAIEEASRMPEVVSALNAGGQVATKLSPAEAQKFVVKSLAKFDAVAKKANITLN